MLSLIAKNELLPYTLTSLKPFGTLIQSVTETNINTFAGAPLRELLKKESLILFRGFAPLSKEDFLKFSGSAELKFLEWDFGPVMEMTPQVTAKNYLFSREKVPFHWDGAFFRTPSFLVFQCVKAPLPQAGGETLFTDTNRIWETTRLEVREIWKQVSLAYTTDRLAHYGGTITNPLLSTHPRKNNVVLKFAEPVHTRLNPVTLQIGGLNKTLSELFLRDLTRKIYSTKYCYTHSWQEGDILIADNHALIHGRNAFKDESPRHLRRVQLL